jgi:hypothetical protein
VLKSGVSHLYTPVTFIPSCMTIFLKVLKDEVTYVVVYLYCFGLLFERSLFTIYLIILTCDRIQSKFKIHV